MQHPLGVTSVELVSFATTLLGPREPTCAPTSTCVVTGHNRLYATQQNSPLFDHLVGAPRFQSWRRCRLLGPLPEHQSDPGSSRPIRVGVLKFVSGNRENTFLIGSNPVWVRAAPNVNDEHTTVLVYVVGAKIGDAPLDYCFVLFRGCRVAVVGSKFGKVRACDDDRKATPAIERHGALRIWAKRFDLLAIAVDGDGD
jgi:hypothetical protein